MTLDRAPLGDPVVVRSVSAGAAALVRRLAELGVRPGETVVPLHRAAGGGRVLAVGASRVALAGSVLRTVAVAPA